MSETGTTPWQALFDEYLRIVRGAGEILRDADRLMAQGGYVSAHTQSTVGTEQSLHTDAPEKWTTGWFVRFYKLETNPKVFPYVAVFLHDRAGTEDFVQNRGRLREPLVVAGVIRVLAGQYAVTYWHAKHWFWNADEADGPPVANIFLAGSKENEVKNESFAVRLERIKGLAELEQLVVDPLVKLVG